MDFYQWMHPFARVIRNGNCLANRPESRAFFYIGYIGERGFDKGEYNVYIIYKHIIQYNHFFPGNMPMKIIISNQEKEPIYEQIKRQIKESILKGELKEGELLPSIRQLAKDLHISVITTKRAYDDLEREGYITSVVGKGSFVTGQNREFLREMRMKWIEEKMAELVAESKSLNISLEELQEMLKLLYEDLP